MICFQLIQYSKNFFLFFEITGLDSLSEQSEISPIESTQFPNTPIIDWYMTDEERDKYLSLFIQLQPINGVVPGIYYLFVYLFKNLFFLVLMIYFIFSAKS